MHVNKAAGTAATIPPITNGDKAVKLSPKPVSAPIVVAVPKVNNMSSVSLFI